jgi:tetratricopeptide (TPR) repeat protein
MEDRRMKVEYGVYCMVGAVLAGAACAPAATGGAAAPVGAASGVFPEVVCSEGVAVTPSAAAEAARTALIVNRPAEALTGAQAAVAAEADNPQHQFLLGEALIATGGYDEADAALTRTVELCAAFAPEVNMARERGWAIAFERGIEAIEANDTATAVASWEMANVIHAGLPDSHYNLGVIYGRRGELDRAAVAYRTAFESLQGLPADTSAEVNLGRAETRANALSGLLGVGGEQYQADDFAAAGATFRFLTEIDPNFRDAWYNYALTLYQTDQWVDLVPVAQRVVEVDPLNENARTILFTAARGAADASAGTPQEREYRDLALEALGSAEELPVFVSNISLEGEQLIGTVTGNAAAAGQQITLDFTFYGPDGEVGMTSTTVPAPVTGQTAEFQVAYPEGVISSYSYSYR